MHEEAGTGREHVRQKQGHNVGHKVRKAEDHVRTSGKSLKGKNENSEKYSNLSHSGSLNEKIQNFCYGHPKTRILKNLFISCHVTKFLKKFLYFSMTQKSLKSVFILSRLKLLFNQAYSPSPTQKETNFYSKISYTYPKKTTFQTKIISYSYREKNNFLIKEFLTIVRQLLPRGGRLAVLLIHTTRCPPKNFTCF